MTPTYQPCVSQPISFLRLERYLQRTVSDAESARIREHVQACAACRACLDQMQREVIELAPLPLPSSGPVRESSALRWRKPAGALVAAVAAAAAALLILARDASVPAIPKSHVQVKGGELAIELVREHRGTIASDTSVFLPADRFAVRVNCPPAGLERVEVVVFDESGPSFPLQPQAALRCGNGVTLPGAFELTGPGPVTVCVELADQPLDRERLKRDRESALGSRSACTTVVAGHRERP